MELSVSISVEQDCTSIYSVKLVAITRFQAEKAEMHQILQRGSYTIRFVLLGSMNQLLDVIQRSFKTEGHSRFVEISAR